MRHWRSRRLAMCLRLVRRCGPGSPIRSPSNTAASVRGSSRGLPRDGATGGTEKKSWGGRDNLAARATGGRCAAPSCSPLSCWHSPPPLDVTLPPGASRPPRAPRPGRVPRRVMPVILRPALQERRLGPRRPPARRTFRPVEKPELRSPPHQAAPTTPGRASRHAPSGHLRTRLPETQRSSTFPTDSRVSATLPTPSGSPSGIGIAMVGLT